MSKTSSATRVRSIRNKIKALGKTIEAVETAIERRIDDHIGALEELQTEIEAGIPANDEQEKASKKTA